MITAKYHFFITPMFRLLTRFLVKRHFASVHTASDYVESDRPVLLIANHISWWDGFWLDFYNQNRVHKKFHFMMLESQLRKHSYFQYAGGFSVKKKSKESVKSIEYTLQLLNDGSNLVLMFPQGEINSSYNNQILFQKGIKQILSKCNNNLDVLFVANLTDYFSKPKPALYIYSKTYASSFFLENDIEAAYNLFYNSILDKHKLKTS